ncbi:SDR family NAD(P)-dependent oxidoreductase [Pseudonocardia sp. RS010]|uniref:SDR family NAD(P)-dependent oxidoreductase n=1 Tax=Pseudonocardia sp. RS010 TaxID=3385979 RepID=UPI0039A21099
MEQRIAVVTGASSGIGAAFARTLAGRGYRVLAVARRAERLVALRDVTSGAVVPLVVDLTRPGAADEVVAAAERLGPVDLLVANAGRGVVGPFQVHDPVDATSMVQLNVVSTTQLVRGLLPGMVERRSGGVIVVSSVGGLAPAPWMAVYGATKAYLASFAQALAEEVRGTGVRVTALCPGPTVTEFDVAAGLVDGGIASAPGALTPEQVAADALAGWERSRTMVIPGLLFRILSVIQRVLPRDIVTRMSGSALRKAATSLTLPPDTSDAATTAGPPAPDTPISVTPS